MKIYKMENRYYLYRHIRLDKNNVFYIGIGTKDNTKYKMLKTEYKRAFTRSKRNNFWSKITNQTDYEVEILLESDDYEFIKQKEIEFIALYGRRDLGLGTLCNLTDGGEGGCNLIKTKKQLKIMSERMKGENNPFYGKTHTEETKLIISKVNSRPCTEEEKQKISLLLKGRKISEEDKEKRYSFGNLITTRCKHIKTDLEFESISSGCTYFNINYKKEKELIRRKYSTRSFDKIGNSIRGNEYTCYDEITGNKYNSIAKACSDLKLNYDKTRKIYKKGLSRIKHISELNGVN